MNMRLMSMALLVLVGCSDAPDDSIKPEGPLPAGDLQPLTPGRVWTYVGSVGETQVRRIAGIDKVGQLDCIVYEIRTGATVQRLWMRAEQDGLKHYRVQQDKLPPVDLDDAAIHYQLPATAGAKWEYEDGTVIPVVYRGSVEAIDTINVPAGQFRCVRIRTIGTTDKVNMVERVAWYAPGVGLVREECTLNKGDGVERGSIALKDVK